MAGHKPSPWAGAQADQIDFDTSAEPPTEADPRVCPDCGVIHGDPDMVYESREEAQLYSSALYDDLQRVAAKYPQCGAYVITSAQSATGFDLYHGGASSAEVLARAIVSMLDLPGVADQVSELMSLGQVQ